jgi:hypothetical protein
MDQPAIYSETLCEKVMGVSAFSVWRVGVWRSARAGTRRAQNRRAEVFALQIHQPHKSQPLFALLITDR